MNRGGERLNLALSGGDPVGGGGQAIPRALLIRRLLAWGPVAVWAAVLFLLSAQRVIVTPAWLPYADKFGHMGLYGVLGALLARGRWRSGSRAAPSILVLLGVLYGAR